MKQEIIKTGIQAPTGRRYSDDLYTKDLKFIDSMIEFLKLPEGWDNIVGFERHNDFITLEQKRGYGRRQTFRKFKRGAEATISKEQLNEVLYYIERDLKSTQDRTRQNKRYSYYYQLCAHVLESSDEWGVTFGTDHISIQSYKKINYEKKITGRVKIDMDGLIYAPVLFVSETVTGVENLKPVVAEYEAVHAKLVEKAHEVKSKLPDAFFKPEVITI